MLSCLGLVSAKNSQSDRTERGPCCRQSLHFSGSFVTSSNPSHRVDIESADSQSDLCFMGKSNDRTICFTPESQSSNILFMNPTSPSASDRCSVNIVESDVCLRISTDRSYSQSAEAHDSVSLPTNYSGASVATQTLVHRSTSDGSRLSKKTSKSKKSFKSTSNKNTSSKPRDIQSVGLEALNRGFRSNRFSKKVRKLLSASWRSGTRKDYAVKFHRFSSWCSEHEKDPYTASLVECAEFLCDLY